MNISLYVFNRKIALFLVTFFCIPAGLISAQTATSTATSTTESEIGTSTSNHVYKSEYISNDGRVQGDFVVGPGKIEVSLAPGESRTVELLVTNRTGEDKVFSIDFEDMSGGDRADQAVVLLGNDRGPYTLRDYLSVEQPTFVLEHMERVSVPVTISIPPDAEPGGHYGSVLFSISSFTKYTDIKSSTKPASAIISRIGTLFFVTTEGDVDREGSLVDFSTKNKQRWFSKGEIPFQIVFENTGSQHLNPYGYLSIKNLFGEEVGFVEIDPWFVLPNAIRSRNISFSRELMFGYYRAELQMNRGYEDLVDTKTLTFIVVPWQLLAITFAGLVMLFLLMRLLLSRFEIKRK